ncbi:ribonuclease H1 domain-containing protein, partial [Salmonella enterica subsp. enterica serovar Paratyphi A]
MFMGAGDESYSTVKPYSVVAGQRKKYYYAVARGRKDGIYKRRNQCNLQVKGYKN